eukprot:1704152-Prymnesium_polylepis.2
MRTGVTLLCVRPSRLLRFTATRASGRALKAALLLVPHSRLKKLSAAQDGDAIEGSLRIRATKTSPPCAQGNRHGSIHLISSERPKIATVARTERLGLCRKPRQLAVVDCARDVCALDDRGAGMHEEHLCASLCSKLTEQGHKILLGKDLDHRSARLHKRERNAVGSVRRDDDILLAYHHRLLSQVEPVQNQLGSIPNSQNTRPAAHHIHKGFCVGPMAGLVFSRAGFATTEKSNLDTALSLC